MKDVDEWETKLKLAAVGQSYLSISKTLFDFTREARRAPRLPIKRFNRVLASLANLPNAKPSLQPRLSDARTVFEYKGPLSALPNNLQLAAQTIRRPPMSRPFRQADQAKAEYVHTLLEELLEWEPKPDAARFLVTAFREVQKYLNLPYRPLKRTRLNVRGSD